MDYGSDNIQLLNENEWPVRLLAWYREVKRDLPWRRTHNPYFIWVSEVMLQQTQVKTVIPYYHAFLERFPSLEILAQAQLEEVLTMWRGLGYYSRAKNLWRGAGFVVETWKGKIPEDYESLLKIPGVGEYTAGAVASIAFGERVPAIDGNVKRVLARFFAWEEAIESAKSHRFLMNYLKEWQPVEHAGDFNQAMMELGATVCSPKSPKCLECPFQEGCQGFILGTPQFFPVKRSKEKVTEAVRPTLILIRNGKVLLKKRPPEGLLANLWEFPGEEYLTLIEQDVAEKTSGYGEKISAELWFSLYQNQVSNRSYDDAVREILGEDIPVRGPIVHKFSHRRWRVFWVILDLSGLEGAEENLFYEMKGAEEFRWMDENEMEKIALPVAFQKVWAEAKANLSSSQQC